jgi:3',5'-cyclic AMP phosphodiesterase CpdA
MPVRIAHISDPHFGAASHEEVWGPVAEHLRSLSLHLLVVTGDIADSPKRHFFDDAHNAFEGLQVPYLVVPGNHDRYTKGNKILNKWLGRLSGPAEYFDQVFQGRVAVPDVVAKMPLKQEAYQRILRIVGIDSSRRADFFARGYVHPKDILSASSTIAGSTGSDLNFALIHHHLLAVRALEEAHRGQVGSLADVTTLVNAGSVLESFSVAQVSLVLHGHEHALNCAF